MWNRRYRITLPFSFLLGQSDNHLGSTSSTSDKCEAQTHPDLRYAARVSALLGFLGDAQETSMQASNRFD